MAVSGRFFAADSRSRWEEADKMPTFARGALIATIGLTMWASGLVGQQPTAVRDVEWSAYGGGPRNIRYSALDQINRSNVNQLKVAWTFDSGDAFPGSEMQCNPIMVHGVLFVTTPKNRVLALDAAQGTLRWSFDPNHDRKMDYRTRIRGVNYWEDGEDQRIYFAAGQYLYALDAKTGAPVAGFGSNGHIDLREGFGRDPRLFSISITSPGVVYKDLLIEGSIVSETLPAAPGDIRAFDTRTGKLRWTFHTIPRPGEFGYNTWPKDAWTYTGAANSWAGMSLDEKRGLVFVPTGSAAFDFWGGNRVGDDLFANCLIALKADTGERVWHFQVVKHDVWDRDLPAPPNLVTVQRNGRVIDAVVQATKTGHLFVFERETGKPLFPIEYHKVPSSDVEGELLAESEPIPLKPAPLLRQLFTDEIVTRRTPAAHQAVLDRLHQLRHRDEFEPPSMQGTVLFPGYDGGAEWGGAAFDPETGLYYVNSNEMVWLLKLVRLQEKKDRATGRELYFRYCASCHRADRKGTPPDFPSLVSIGEKYDELEVAKIINTGRGRMPAFARLNSPTIDAITRYLVFGETIEVPQSGAPSPYDLPYAHDGYNKLLDPDGYPAIEPPWGSLNAVNLSTGEFVWRIPLGEYPELAAKGMHNTGCENYGGPIVTAGGLVFIGATLHDRKFHAFDKASGTLLWETTLPVAATATPATYTVNGRQFVVIGAGGGKYELPSGGVYIAFALPRDTVPANARH
jgi:quinoprotein glucose dehydrogenase